MENNQVSQKSYSPSSGKYPIEKAHINSLDQYKEIYDRSIQDPEAFWSEIAERITWFKKWDQVCEYDFVNASVKWFEGATLNACYNCLDRHIEDGHGDDTALIWEGNNPNDDKTYTFNQLLTEVKKFSNVLKAQDIKKGDRVCLYLQMIPELAIAVLACARIGAVHSVVFGAFSADALRDRINDSECKLLVTQDTAVRGAKGGIPMKANADQALAETPSIQKVIVIQRTGDDVDFDKSRDVWWHEAMLTVDDDCSPEVMLAEDPLFILYTSGSTGQPKGVLHTTGGYMVYTSYSHEIIFDYHPGDVYWCTADIGWITGHSYIIYGPLANRAITVMFEGVPNYPDFGRFWQVVEKHQVNLFYTAPTALRALMKEGDSWVEKYDRSSLRLLGTVGETIKEPEWTWYYNIVGNQNCPIVDTWWQTETGGILITPLPAISDLKPGSAMIPFFGIDPVLLDENGNEVEGNPASGYLCIKSPWPSLMRTVYGDHERFRQTYFDRFPGYYMAGDGAMRDADGHYWITGRVDDVLNVSGHRLGTAEIEGAIGQYETVAEAAVVGYQHDIKGQGVYAYVTLMTGQSPSEQTVSGIKQKVRTLIGPHATPDKIQFTPSLPKTRSGKIMRRILRKIAEGDTENLGDTSTLSDPTVVDDLLSGSEL
ncbi:acetate--CoA ligase [Candidatus Poribacteria bacterium]|nr:acetate--CoA ligase [Candidatus Poribacteria bacterium]